MTRSSGAWAIEAVDVAVTFGEVPALLGVSMQVAAGESVAILGSSGSGKSTLLHCLAGLREADSGTINVAGQDLGALSDQGRSALRLSQVGIVFQFGELVPELTILDNVALPAWLGGHTRAEARVLATELLCAFSIGHTSTQVPGQVSGGERQRAAVARALVHRPSVVLADEPTGSLDSANADRVVDELLGVATNRGAAVVMVTHEARLATRADRTLTLRDGQFVEPAAIGP